MKESKKVRKGVALHWQILIGMALGLVWSLIAIHAGLQEFTMDWVKPFGTLFMRMLKMVAVPLVLVSLIQGVSSLSDISSLSRMGFRTILLFICTTIFSILVGLGVGNAIKPGNSFSEETRTTLMEKYGSVLQSSESVKSQVKDEPLRFLVDLVPENFFKATSDNTLMLQVIVFALVFGVALLMIPKEKSALLIHFFDGANLAVLKMVDFIMMYSPVGVAGLMAGVLVDIAGDDPEMMGSILWSLLNYSLTVVGGLLLQIFGLYPVMLLIFVKKYRSIKSLLNFYRALLPVHMLAFSTSSSAATLPLNMERCEQELKLKKQVTGFVLPLGATINMDGTSLYQAVATLFIAQAFGMDLSLGQQAMIVLTAVLASIGSAAVPGAGMVMLVIVLTSVGIHTEGIALIMATDRILDMLRTVANITSDATVATIIDAGENGKLNAGTES